MIKLNFKNCSTHVHSTHPSRVPASVDRRSDSFHDPTLQIRKLDNAVSVTVSPHTGVTLISLNTAELYIGTRYSRPGPTSTTYMHAVPSSKHPKPSTVGSPQQQESQKQAGQSSAQMPPTRGRAELLADAQHSHSRQAATQRASRAYSLTPTRSQCQVKVHWRRGCALLGRAQTVG